MGSTMTRTLKGRKGNKRNFITKKLKAKEECFSSLSKNYEAAEEPLPPSCHPQCFSRSTGPRACVLTYIRLCFSHFLSFGGSYRIYLSGALGFHYGAVYLSVAMSFY
jgi:hypothetical protein